MNCARLVWCYCNVLSRHSLEASRPPILVDGATRRFFNSVAAGLILISVCDLLRCCICWPWAMQSLPPSITHNSRFFAT